MNANARQNDTTKVEQRAERAKEILWAMPT